MGKFDGVLLVSDFDDTLYGSDDTVSAENVRALTYFTQEGGTFTIATGRAHTTMAPVVHLAPVNAPVILSNGSGLYDFKGDFMIHKTYLTPEVRADMIEVCAAFPTLGFEAYHGEDIYTFRPNAITRYHLRRAQCVGKECPIEDMPRPWGKAILQQENSILKDVQRYMKGRWGAKYEVIFSNKVLLEVTCKGSTKGGMVLHLARLLGIDSKHIYCVGDNQNDLPMLAISAIPFAPANCAEEVKNWGAKVIRSCDESCLAQIVDILDGMY